MTRGRIGQCAGGKREMKRFAGIGMVVLLILAALFLPRGWFVLRDAAALDNFHEESLAPLMVADLDSSYERRTFERIRNYMGAQATGDVICRSKDVDIENAGLQEELEQAMTCTLMNVLQEYGLVELGYGAPIEIESCTQYVLIRESDGQILLVANDILLSKGDGIYAELLVDGVDGTVYYLGSDEYGNIRKVQSVLYDSDIQLWYWVASDTYALLSDNDESPYTDVEVNESYTLNVSGEKTGALTSYLDSAYSDVWIYEDESSLTFCYRLPFGQNLTSWSLEINDIEENNLIRFQIGFQAIVSEIPEMAQRIELAQYEEFFED